MILLAQAPEKAAAPIRNSIALEAAIIAATIFAACIFGISTRQIFSLASVWPANAVLLGMLLTNRHANHPITWILATIAYLAADLLTGTELLLSLHLTAANLVGVAGALAAAGFMLKGEPIRLCHPVGAVMMILVMTFGSAGAAATSVLIGPSIFGDNRMINAALWFSSEFVNYALFLPALIAASGDDPNRFRIFSRDVAARRFQMAALVTLALLVLSTYMIGGPLAGAYVVPGILWCAISFRPLAASLLALLTGVWLLLAGPTELLPLRINFSDVADVFSFRLGIGMIALGSFVVSIISSVWQETNERLSYVATHDALTGLLNRAAFLERVTDRMGQPGRFSLLMLDVDHFKAINDTYGHAAGDKALEAAALLIRQSLGSGDFAGRLGGEEFAILLASKAGVRGLAEADVLRQAFETQTVLIPTGEDIGFTVSVGVSEGRQGSQLPALLGAADGALYSAKNAGRNRAILADEIDAAQHPPKPQPGKRRYRGRRLT